MRFLQIKIAFGLLLTLEGCVQDKLNITGEWIEIRREGRPGFVYDFRGRLHEPSIKISFSDNGQGTFLNTQIPAEIEPKMTIDYNFLRNSLLVFGKVYEIVKFQGDSLVLIRRNVSKFKSDYDVKFYFLKKETYDKLTDSERKQLAAPGEKDEQYLSTLKPLKRTEWN